MEVLDSGIGGSAQPDSSDSSTAYSAHAVQESGTSPGQDSPCFKQGRIPVRRTRTAPLAMPREDEAAKEEVPRTAPHKLETYDPAVHGEKKPATTEQRSKTPSSSSLPASLSAASVSSPPPAASQGQSGACGGTFSESESCENVEINNVPSSDRDGGAADEEGLTKSVSTLEVQGTIKMGGQELSYQFKGDPEDVHKQGEQYFRLAKMMTDSPSSKTAAQKPSPPPSSQTDTDQPIFMTNISSDITSGKNTKPDSNK